MQETFGGKSSFKTWLYSVVRNYTLDRLRQTARHKETPLDECFEASDETDIENSTLYRFRLPVPGILCALSAFFGKRQMLKGDLTR